MGCSGSRCIGHRSSFIRVLKKEGPDVQNAGSPREKADRHKPTACRIYGSGWVSEEVARRFTGLTPVQASESAAWTARLSSIRYMEIVEVG